MNYFVKELVVSNPFILSNGKPIDWELVGDDTGVLATNDQALVTELSAFAEKRRGVGVITQERYEYLKKNPRTPRQLVKSLADQTYKLINTRPSLSSKPVDSAPSAVAPDAAKVAAAASPAPVAAAPDVPKKKPVVLKTKRQPAPAKTAGG